MLVYGRLAEIPRMFPPSLTLSIRNVALFERELVRQSYLPLAIAPNVADDSGTEH